VGRTGRCPLSASHGARRASPSNTSFTYGIQLPVQSQSTIYAEAWEADAGPGDLVEIARTADRSGFDYIASCDHVAIPGGSPPP
jgi:hypothetical protein